MKVRPDWRLAVAVMAVVLVVGLVVVVVAGPQATAGLLGVAVSKDTAECDDAGGAASGEKASSEDEKDAEKDSGKDADKASSKDEKESDKDSGKDAEKDSSKDSEKDSSKDSEKDSGKDADEASSKVEKNSSKDSGEDAEKDAEKGAGEDAEKGAEKGAGEDDEKGAEKDAEKDSGKDAKDAEKDSGKDAKDADAAQEDCDEQASGSAKSSKTGTQADGDDEQFAGRDQIGRASRDEYVDIQSVQPNQKVGEGGDFSGGSFAIECALSDHKNSDNPIIAPGVRNGAQHTHDYAGNESTNFASDSDSLAEAGTTCTNGDKHPFFWPVLRDLTGTGPDVGADGGSLDGNVGSFIEPSEVTYEFRGHGSRATEPMPLNLVLSTGAAKASTADGEGSNAKFSCSGFTDRVTDQYPLCPSGSQLQRIFDFPSCWNGQDLDSEDHTSHLVFPDEQGECADDEVPVPAARITVNYDTPSGRSFAIDSFPDQQHDPITDHALFENLTSEQRAQDGADCINENQKCLQGAAENAAFSTDPKDRVPPSLTFAHALSSHALSAGPQRRAAPELSAGQSAVMLLAAAAVAVVASVGTGPRLVARLRDAPGGRGRRSDRRWPYRSPTRRRRPRRAPVEDAR